MRHVLGMLAIMMGLSLTAQATPIITVTDIEMQKFDTVTVHVPGGYNGGAYVGQFILTTNLGVFGAWCIDLYHETFLGPQTITFDLGPITTDSNGKSLTATQIQEIGGLVNYGNALLAGGGGTNDQSAAVQLAIWKIEVPAFTWDGNPTLDALVAADIALAPTLIDPGFAMLALNGQQTLSCGNDDCSGGGGGGNLPEPNTLVMFMLALATLFVLGSRHRRFRMV
jgi:hypothetical protein